MMPPAFRHITDAAVFLETLADDLTPGEVRAGGVGHVEAALFKIEAAEDALRSIRATLKCAAGGAS